MVEAAKLKGLYPKEQHKQPLQLQADNLHIYGGIDYSKASPDTILNAKQALLELAESAKRNTLEAKSAHGSGAEEDQLEDHSSLSEEAEEAEGPAEADDE